MMMIHHEQRKFQLKPTKARDIKLNAINMRQATKNTREFRQSGLIVVIQSHNSDDVLFSNQEERPTNIQLSSNRNMMKNI
jgi:uncharacterized protein YcsI (UPF0317 family)